MIWYLAKRFLVFWVLSVSVEKVLSSFGERNHTDMLLSELPDCSTHPTFIKLCLCFLHV